MLISIWRIGLLIIGLTLFPAFSANGQSLKLTQYEAKSCLNMAWDKENIIKNEAEFLQKVRNDMSRERCLKELEKVDFAKHDLVGVDINSGYCRYPIGLAFKATKSVENKQFEVKISWEPGAICRALSSYHLWLLIPKIPVEYKLKFNPSAREKKDLTQLERAFIAEFNQDFQFIKSEINSHTVGTEKHQYWLVHVKPKQTGFFTIKYEYLFADKFYAEGETEMKIAVGGKNGSRYPQIVREIGYFCLGDTIIIPVRLSKFSKHSFSLQSKYVKAEEIEDSRKTYNSYPNLIENEKIVNPLEANLKYVGKYRADNLYRNGGGTFTYFALFEAKNEGKFNIALSDESKKETDSTITTTPVIIINRGTPLTLLVPKEKATYYIKGRSYSSDYNNSFESNLIIGQPGEVIAIPFLFTSEEPWWRDKSELKTVKVRNLNPIPFIFKQPFYIKTDEGFNNWVNDYLP